MTTSPTSLLVDDGRAAFQAGPAAFQAWVTAVMDRLCLAHWQSLLLNLIAYPKPLRPAERQFLNQALTYPDLHLHLLIVLIQNQEIELAKTFALAISGSDSKDFFFLSFREIEFSILRTVDKLSDPQKKLELYEFIFNHNPNNITASLHLLDHALQEEDQFSALIYCQTILEAVESGCSYRSQTFGLFLGKLYLKQYFECFFVLGSAYAKLFKPQERPEVIAVLALIAAYYTPEYAPEFDGLWAFQNIIDDDIASDFAIKLQAYLPMGEQLTSSALSIQDDPLLKLQLLASATKYQGIGGYFDRLKQNLALMQADWGLEQLQSLGVHPPGFVYKITHQIYFRYVYLMNYVTDKLSHIRPYQNHVASLYAQACHGGYPAIQPWSSADFPQPEPAPGRPLKVGYFSHTFKRHSVGFLCVETLGFHDFSSVQPYLYNFDSIQEDDITEQFRRGAYVYRNLSKASFDQIIQQVREDNLDILVYLDVLTSQKGINLVSFRLAPIQVAWLGGDSPGIPAMDYFLVDDYLLPDDAQDYYPERLVRLPTFVAVSSFAVNSDDPLRFRQALGIPTEAVIYVTAAIGYKRNPDWIECQLEIIRQVPNAYLVVKGIGDLGYMTQQFQSMADQRGIGERIRFLAFASSQESHRGQMAFMDIMLDTFPYTGATHTLECLWLGVPVLTCFGEHYFSRMSYSMVMTLGGMDPCIADSPADYIAKGIALGLDPELRQRMKLRLWHTRHSSILWDPYRQCRTLETVYRQLVGSHNPEQPAFQRLVPSSTAAEGTDATGDVSSAAAWNQAGLEWFRQGQGAREEHHRREAYEAARECWRRGLEGDPQYLPCVVNRILVLWYLGYAQQSWQTAAQLTQEIWVAEPDLSPWHTGGPLEAALIWIPSFNSAGADPRSRYLHLLSRWQCDYFSIVTNRHAQGLWNNAYALNPRDQDANLVVALNLLQGNQALGLYRLYPLQDHPRASQALSLATQPPIRDPHRRGGKRPQPWIDYAGIQLFLEPRLESAGTVALLARGDWFEGELQWLRNYLQPGMGVIDVGANIGVYTFAAAQQVGPEGRVWAIEPTPSCVECLRQTVAVNALAQVQVVAAAAGNSEQTVSLIARGSSVFNRVSDVAPAAPEVSGLPYRVKADRQDLQIPQITLDSFWQEQGSPAIHLIKIDTEGAELKVLQGSQTLIETCRPALIVEVAGQEKNAHLAEQTALWLHERGYHLFSYLPGLEALHPVAANSSTWASQWGEYHSVFNLVALPKNPS